MDELEKTFHYAHWREDLALVPGLGIRHLRYGPPYYRVHAGPDRYDWGFTDEVMAEMRRLGIVPIIDLCHFGVPGLGRRLPEPGLARPLRPLRRGLRRALPLGALLHAGERDLRLRQAVRPARPVERAPEGRPGASSRPSSTSCRANLLAVRELLRVRPDAIVIQSESAEYFHAAGSDPACVRRAGLENERRFLSFDFLYSVPPCAEITLYLLDNGLTREELAWFMGHGLGQRIVMGNDFYERNEQLVTPDGRIEPAGEVFGWNVIARQYYERYRHPVMHTETNWIASSVRRRKTPRAGCGRSSSTYTTCAGRACRCWGSPGSRSSTRWTGTAP